MSVLWFRIALGLTNDLVPVFQRVSLTRHHKIVRYPENPPMPLPNPTFGMITGKFVLLLLSQMLFKILVL